MLKLRPVPFKDVTIQDSFWAPRRETNRVASIPFSLQKLEEAGNLEDMRLAARGATNGFRGPVFMDSDLYKALEAASYSLATHPDPALEKQLDDIIGLLAAAQQPDGYLNSYFTVKEPGKRWTNLRDWHELYCAGHMFEAAVAHYQATGKTTFLNIATRYADYIDSVFGPPPKRLGYPGHPEIELALVKLWRATGNQRYFELARFFVENRGRKFFATEHHTPLDKYDGSYWQDDVPIYDHQNIKGHAVRAAYLMSGVTEVAAQTGDERLLSMLDRVWRNTTERNQYITGGIGPSAHNEGFTVDYDLPNLTAYQETCATIALAQWAHRLALLYGDARYADVAGARALQRRALRRVAGRHEVLLRQPAGKRRHAPSLAVVRLRLLPAECHAHPRRAGRLRLRRQRRFALRQPLHPGLRPGEGRRHRRRAQGDDRLPVGRQSRAGACAGRAREVRPAAARARLVPERHGRGEPPCREGAGRRARLPGPRPRMEAGRPGGAGPADAGPARRRQSARQGRPGPAGHPARADCLLPGAVRPERAARGALAAAGSRAQGRARAGAARRRGHHHGRSPRRVPSRTGGRTLYQPAAPAEPRRAQGDPLLRLGQPPGRAP